MLNEGIAEDWGVRRTASGMQRLQADLACLASDLPLHPNAAIFVATDAGHSGVLRVVMTGPVHSPYAFGLFQFDVYVPAAYPAIPPLVSFATTGGGRARFNPNLCTTSTSALR